jgi:hypothetical protein
MKLNSIGINMTEVEMELCIVLFSYKTPVAFYDKDADMYYKTDKYWSRTTSRHIRQWLRDNDSNCMNIITQKELDNLL